MILACSTDWFAELLRERLLEVYDKELVDQILPYKKEGFQEWLHDLQNTISDEELDRIGMLQDAEYAKELFDIDESLLYIKPRKEKLVSEPRSKLNDEGIYGKINIP